MDNRPVVTKEHIDGFFNKIFTKQDFEETNIDCTLLESDADRLVFKLSGYEEQSLPYCSGVLFDRNEYRLCPVTFKKEGNDTICIFSLPDLFDEVKDIRTIRWKVRLLINDGKDFSVICFHEKAFEAITNDKNYFDFYPEQRDVLQECVIENQRMVTVPYMTKFGNWAIAQCREEKKYMLQLNTKATMFSMRKGIFKIRFISTLTDKDWKGLLMDYGARLETDKRSFFVPAEKISYQNDHVALDFTIDLKNYEFGPLLWYFRPCFEENGETYCVKFACRKQAFTTQLTKLFQDNRLLLEDDLILFPYLTNDDSIALMCREKNEYDGIGFRFRELMALVVYHAMKERYDSQNILLVYEKYCQMAQDNGYYFFKYCMDNNIEEKTGRKIYYIIDKKSPDYEKLKPYAKNVLQFMSLKFLVKMVAAKLLVSSDSKVHAYVWRSRPSRIRPIVLNKKAVFLQHGVTAFKRVDEIYRKGAKNSCELFVVTSEGEKEIVKNRFNYSEDEIAITGFARWDVLHDCSEGNRKILMMPTWRNWLDDITEETFVQSEYYKNYMALLNSGRLKELLEETDTEMIFYIHPKFRQHIGNFNCECEKVQIVPFGTVPLNELMMESNLLITDYSSVAWDVFYQGKPVLFYQFDIDKYMEAHGSYIDMETELFGDRAMNADELIELIEKCINRDFALEPKYKDMLPRCFSYIDDNNSQRIFDCITEKGL